MFNISDQEYWYEEARIALRRRLYEYDGKRPHARNVILLVGDGLGLVTLTASRIFKGQRQGKSGESSHLAWDKFPAVALAKVGHPVTVSVPNSRLPDYTKFQ